MAVYLPLGYNCIRELGGGGGGGTDRTYLSQRQDLIPPELFSSMENFE